MHLTYSNDDFLPPQLLPAPEVGGALDYLNVFHVSVAHWPSSGRAVPRSFPRRREKSRKSCVISAQIV